MGRDGGYVICHTRKGVPVIMDTDNYNRLWMGDKWVDVRYIKHKEMPIFDREVEKMHDLEPGELQEICKTVLLLVG